MKSYKNTPLTNFCKIFILLTISLSACEKVKVTDPTNPTVKPDLNTYIYYDIEGTKVTYSDTAFYLLYRNSTYDLVTDYTGLNYTNSNTQLEPPGLNVNTNKFEPFPHFALKIQIANFSNIKENQTITTDSTSFYSYVYLQNYWSSTLVSIYKKNNAIFEPLTGIDTTSIVYEGGIFINAINSTWDHKRIGDWKPSYKSAKIKITKIEDFKVTSAGLSRNYRMITV